MKTSELTVEESLPMQSTTAAPNAVIRKMEVNLPLGLFGFEKVKKYTLIGHSEEAPFLRLQKADDSNVAFLMVQPIEVIPGYRPDISAEDVEFLGLTAPQDALLLAIVTLQGPDRATANLKGPIVINRHTFVGKQVIPLNAANYSVQHLLQTTH